MIGAQATNEEAFALKSLVKDTIGSEQIATLSWSPPGASGDDGLLVRANKNPNTRGLSALGLAPDRLDALSNAVAAGELKMLIVMRADLVKALGEAEFIRRFGALDYLLVLDTDANEIGQMANQLWPIGAYPEIDGSFTNFKGRVQKISAALPPPGQALSALEAIARLGHALDGVERAKTAEAVFAAMAQQEPAFAAMALEALGPHGRDLAQS